MARKSVTQKVLEMSIEDIGQQNKSTLAKYYKSMRSALGKRMKTFREAGEFSHAYNVYEREFKKEIPMKVSEMTQGRLQKEVVRLKKFFEGETSTVEGAQEVNRRQDMMIFGAIPGTNIPNRTMSVTERKEYWDLFDEWYAQEYEAHPKLQSSEIQNTLADLMYADNGEFNSMLLTEKMAFLSERASEAHEMDLRRKSSSVLRGKGSNFAR